MKTITKGFIALAGFVVSIGIYYYLSIAIESFWYDYCVNSYCMKTLSLAEFLSIEAAAIGVYFVVSSIDDWKKEDQYQTAKKNIKLLHSIYKKLELYNVQLANLESRRTKLYIIIDKRKESKIENTQLYNKYRSWLHEIEIKKDIKEADYSITQQSKNLFQEDFNRLIGFAHDYIFNIDSKITKKDKELIKQQTNDIKPIHEEYENKLKNANNPNELQNIRSEFIEKTQLYNRNLKQDDIDLIHAQEYSMFHNFSKELDTLQKKLNRFLE